MAHRTFVDSAGKEWLAFDVVPRPDERRRVDRRCPDEARSDAEDRRDLDRRLTVGGRSPLATAVAEGWLCFERDSDRRRLCPIPEHWMRRTDAELEAYCQSARPVRRDLENSARPLHEQAFNQ